MAWAIRVRNMICDFELTDTPDDCLGVSLEHLGLQDGDHLLHTAMNAAGDGHGTHTNFLGDFLTGKVMQEDVFDRLASLFFELVQRFLQLLTVFFQIHQLQVARIGNRVAQGHGRIELLANRGVEAQRQAILRGQFAIAPFLNGDAQFGGDFAIGGLTVQQFAETFADALAFFVELLPAAGNLNGTGAIAQEVQHFTANVRHGEGTEGATLMGIEPLNGANQAEVTNLFEVFVGFGALVANAMGNLAYKTRIQLDQLIPDRNRGVLVVGNKKFHSTGAEVSLCSHYL
jgi:hypothetical protein